MERKEGKVRKRRSDRKEVWKGRGHKTGRDGGREKEEKQG